MSFVPVPAHSAVFVRRAPPLVARPPERLCAPRAARPRCPPQPRALALRSADFAHDDAFYPSASQDDYDALQSDDTHVVVDAAEIAHLLDRLQDDSSFFYDDSSPESDVSSTHDRQSPTEQNPLAAIDAAFLNAAERFSDLKARGSHSSVEKRSVNGEAERFASSRSESAPAPSPMSAPAPPAASTHPPLTSTPASAPAPTLNFEGDAQFFGPPDPELDLNPSNMRYFVPENKPHMPSWARDLYDDNCHTELQDAADRVHPHQHRLHDIVDRKPAMPSTPLSSPASSYATPSTAAFAVTTNSYLTTDTTTAHIPAPTDVGDDGVVDCTLRDVADDYRLPVEFVVDALVSYGVPLPISEAQSVRNSMTTEEIEKLLAVISSFDWADLSDRYSDRTIHELADDYDLDVARLLEICRKEGFYLYAGADTRLSVVREDRVLDIMLKGHATGQPYPPLLEGLE